MINIYPYDQLGHVDHGWLNARHHFSFAGYQNPDRLRFGALRIINDDIIRAGSGFDTHPHQNMEIITYVRTGAITHRDNQGNEGRTEAGDVQVMSAGSGIFHSEFNLETEDTVLYQIWIEPNKTDVQPRWDQRKFPKKPVEEDLNLMVSGDDDDALFIYQDARIYAGRLPAKTRVTQPLMHQAYVLVSKGTLEIAGHTMSKGDGAEITDTAHIEIESITDAEVLVIDVPESSIETA